MPRTASSDTRRNGAAFLAGLALVAVAGTGVRAVDAGADAPADPPPVVALAVVGCDDARAGTATVVGPDLLVTAGHVVDRALSVTVVGESGATTAGTVVAIDPEGRDLALVRTEVPVGDGAPVLGEVPGTGDAVSAHGHPGGGPLDVRSGHLVATAPALAYEQPGDELLVTSQAFPPGMSGGPILADGGRLVGIVLGTEQQSRTGLAIPATELGELLDGGAPPPPTVCLPPAGPADAAGRGSARAAGT